MKGPELNIVQFVQELQVVTSQTFAFSFTVGEPLQDSWHQCM